MGLNTYTDPHNSRSSGANRSLQHHINHHSEYNLIDMLRVLAVAYTLYEEKDEAKEEVIS